MAMNPYAVYQKVAVNSKELARKQFEQLEQNERSEQVKAPQMVNSYVGRSNQVTNQYQQNNVLTAPPEKLILMLYDGALKFLKQSITHLEEKNLAESNDLLLRAQDILGALMGSLNPDYEMSLNLESLYDFMNNTLVEANIHKDATRVKQVITMLEDLRGTWQEAMIAAKGC